ncbi:MAG TPA: HAMP domain-containing sensor histidine kinase [Bacteroidales bacterium]|jgi:signal transduction histidine kinase|nr:HAMP domain-containing histidine kinase [Bacteroidales bacterium]MDI9573093.1 HAMP domain-containing sensor histidine kinase [Bacteroidota bacterium]HNZ79102.1 HAMP domain-containing sensor histidine kinase [Bacteroidales bacterium]HOE58893.1 HAMP domain-containing sensor histidine kinase [Bacteroidales bacterium]HOR04721.1 HAMP domain-containing sensor histidine kinase [Bacteroidales bacterium]
MKKAHYKISRFSSKSIVIGITLLLLAGIFSIIWFNNYLQWKKFQKTIYNSYNQISNLTYELKNQLDSNNNYANITNKLKQIKNSDELQIIIYKKPDHLVYWHNNQYLINLNELRFAEDGFISNKKGSFLYTCDSTNEFILMVAFPVWIEFAIQNEGFQPEPSSIFKKFGLFSLCPPVNEGFPIYNSQGKEIFFVEFNNPVHYYPWKYLLIGTLIIIGFYITVIQLFNLIFKKEYQINIFIILSIFILFCLFYKLGKYFEHEYFISYHNYLVIFNKLISYSELLFFSILSAIFIKNLCKILENYNKRKIQKYSKIQFSTIIIFLVYIILLIVFYYVIDQIIINSDISFTPAMFFDITYINGVSLISLFVLLYIILYITIKIVNIFQNPIISKYHPYLLIILILLVTISFISKIFIVFTLLISIASIEVVVIIKNSIHFDINLLEKFLYVLIISLFLILYLIYNLEEKEYSKKQLILMNIESMEQGDPITESLFADIVSEIQYDSLILNLIDNSAYNPVLVENYIHEKYFRGFWNQFHITITICKENERIRITPILEEISCYEYFNHLFDLKPDSIYDTSFIKISDYGHRLNGYTGVISFPHIPFKLFVELLPNPSSNATFLYDLVTSQDLKSRINLENYSFARYFNNKLISFSGSAVFPVDLPKSFIINEKDESSIIEVKSGKFHYSILKSKNKSIYILANEVKRINNFISFLGLFLIIYTIWGIVYFLWNLKSKNFYFNRIGIKFQIVITIILLVSFSIIGYFVYNLFDSNYKNQVKAKLVETIYSVSSEFAYKLIEEPNFLYKDIDLEAFIIKLSNIFFTDINLYDINGKLITSTSPKLFHFRIVEPLINRTAYNVLTEGQATTYLQEEKVGNYNFLSGYIPLRDNDNTIVAYINLPQISRISQQQQQREEYLSTLISVFIFLLIFSLLIALFIANIIVKPLNVLSESLSQLRLGESNIKIPIVRNDEIGLLIEKYNNLVDQLESAINELKHKERDLAWKDIARQIAHEIKNPLTPIRLQIQFLSASFKPGDSNWNKKFYEFSNLLLEQIDLLSQLADAFSELGHLSESKQVQVNLIEIVEEAANIVLTGFSGEFIHHFPDYSTIVKADRNQLLRLFINILKNATQAVQDQENKLIEIKYLLDYDHVIVSIYDNGKGMNEEEKKKIFTPYFTTKSFGTGLGLYISKNIIKAHGGEITFESSVENGTTFYIKLPMFSE